MHRKKLLWQLYFSYLFVTVTSMAAMAWYASSAIKQFYIERTTADLEARALLIEKDILVDLTQRSYADIDALAKESGRKSATRITVILPDGKVVADSNESPNVMENHADRQEIMDALAGVAGKSLRYSNTLHETRLYVAIPVRYEDKIIGVLRTSISLAAFDKALQGIHFYIGLGGLVTAVLVAGISLWLSRRLTRPLEELKQGAERFARGDLTHRLPPGDSQEINSLAETLNQMAEELDEKIRHVVRQRNEREAILTSMIEGVLALDFQERVIRLNHTAARLLGCDPGKVEGKTLQEVVRNPDLHRLVAQVFSTQVPAEGEMTLQHVNGERVFYIHAGVLRGAHQSENGVLVVFHDVTQLKKLETIRRDFVANVSHELRTPVTSIKGFVETLLNGAMHNAEELERFLRIVAAQIDRLNAIIEDLLTLSCIEEEEEKAEILLSDGSVKDVLQTAIEVCQLKAADRNIRVELSCDPQVKASMNPPLLEQAVINLLDNAVKYSLPEETVHVSAVCTDTEIVIQVRDHGCGISSEHLPRIFERFYRVDKARSRKLGGTGLGLAIVKHVAKAHGGRTTVESTVGQGSTFSLHLPIRPAN
ncbi:MAG TPA: ATP-binding protein [Thermoguttaceae bacterium]